MNDELKAKIVVRIITAILAFIAFLVAWDGMLSVSMATKGFCYQRAEIMNREPVFTWSKCK